MIIGRKKELQQLQEAYEASENRLVILCGRKGVGKTFLLREFSRGKKVFLYQAAECSDRQQIILFKQAWEQLYGMGEEMQSSQSLAAMSGIARTQKKNRGDGYLGLFFRACGMFSEKTVIILEDFPRIAKNYENIYQEILSLLQEEENVMVVLTSSTVIWREEELEIPLRPFISRITDRIQLEPFQFLEMVKYFPTLPVGDIIQIYAILGGVPGYLKYWDIHGSVKENILKLFVKPDAALGGEAGAYLKTALRELSLYNTVLCAMKDGITRLNDIYTATGFSRAKISVYMKNLKQLGVVGKVRTFRFRCSDQEVKGMYEITDPLIHFWYRFLYPNQSLCREMEPEEFYRSIIREELEEYTAIYFDRVCIQYLELMNRYGKLPLTYERMGSWYGKEGKIPLLAKDKEGRLLLMDTKWKNTAFSVDDLEELLRYLMKAGINPDCYFLFSKSDFEDGLRKKAKLIRNMYLVDLNDL